MTRRYSRCRLYLVLLLPLLVYLYYTVYYTGFIGSILYTSETKRAAGDQHADIHIAHRNPIMTANATPIRDASDKITKESLAILMKQKAAENSKRCAKLEWFCKSEEALRALPKPTRMHNIPGLNISITLIAKVASTSWVSFLAKTQVPRCLQYIESPLPGYVELHDCVKQSLSTNRQRFAVRAVFVRDPWSRLVSVYEDKIVKQRFIQAEFCYQRWNIPRTINSDIGNGENLPNLSFSQFITCITENKDPSSLDPHYRPQYLMHGLCHANYTHIGTLEDVNNDFLFIMKSAQPNLSSAHLSDMLQTFSAGPRRPWEIIDASQKQLKISHYYRSISDTSMDQLQDIYKWDVLLHSYKLHPL